MSKVSTMSVTWDSEEQVDTGEAELIKAARLEPEAFGELYRRYLPRIYCYLRARSNSEEDAADLTQQVFVQALNALPRYREKGLPFAAWLFRIARNAAINARQRHRATLNWDLLPDAFQPATGQTEGQEQDPEASALKREALDHLGGLLTELNHAKLELLVLRFAAGLTVREIAPVVGKSEAAVHKQLARTLQALKGQLEEKYDEE